MRCNVHCSTEEKGPSSRGCHHSASVIGQVKLARLQKAQPLGATSTRITTMWGMILATFSRLRSDLASP